MRRASRALTGLIALAGVGAGAFAAQAASQPSAYTVANYPVQARAKDAVTAKGQALADGQQGAFRSLLKRLVPVTAYKRLPKLQLVRIQDMISGFSVRRETNSATEYIANLDFEFNPRLVRELLKAQGVPFVEEPAPPVVVVPVYRAPTAVAAALPAHAQPQKGQAAWAGAWKELDLEHALAPVKLPKPGPQTHDDTVRGLLAGDPALLRTLSAEHQSDRIVLAHAEPSPDGARITVTLAGRDAVGPLSLQRTHRIVDNDLQFTSELAAVVALGVLEGRWKALKSRGKAEVASLDTERGGGLVTSAPAPAELGIDSVRMTVEFRGLSQWQQVRSKIAGLPGVEDLEVSQMTARGAAVSLRYPGGAERLGEELAAQGLSLSSQGGEWVLQTAR
jgi:hypothetical protein